MYANKSWTRITDYQQHEIEGKDLCFMQGALTDTISVKQVNLILLGDCLTASSSNESLSNTKMMQSVELTGYGKASLINYTKGGKPFWCEIMIQPIISKDMYGDEQITHLLGTLVKTSTVDPSDTSSHSTSESEPSEQEGTKTSLTKS